MYNIFLFFKGA